MYSLYTRPDGARRWTRIGRCVLPYAIAVTLLAWQSLEKRAELYGLAPSADVSLRRVGKRVPRPIVRKRRKS